MSDNDKRKRSGRLGLLDFLRDPQAQDDMLARAKGLLGTPSREGVPNISDLQSVMLRDGAVSELLNGPIGQSANFSGAIKAFHGSPHLFNKFSMDKIGTGEGAQAYGHGLYFAENPATASNYREALSAQRSDRLQINGQAVRTDDMFGRAIEDMARIGKPAALQKIDDNIRFNEKYAPDVAALWRSTRENVATVDPATVKLNTGNMYDVNMRWPDAAREAKDPLGPQHFLDWDKPLSGQGHDVRRALRKVGLFDKAEIIAEAKMQRESAFDRWVQIDRSLGSDHPFVKTAYADFKALQINEDKVKSIASGVGADIYHNLGRGNEHAARMLRDLGIPGIRYADAGSRGAGGGTSNYVAFDDALVEIMRRNGMAP